MGAGQHDVDCGRLWPPQVRGFHPCSFSLPLQRELSTLALSGHAREGRNGIPACEGSRVPPREWRAPVNGALRSCATDPIHHGKSRLKIPLHASPVATINRNGFERSPRSTLSTTRLLDFGLAAAADPEADAATDSGSGCESPSQTKITGLMVNA